MWSKADWASLQLYRYQMEFKKQATIDELTGVANRRHYEQMSAARWGDCRTAFMWSKAD